jgi:hypothetical protein
MWRSTELLQSKWSPKPTQKKTKKTYQKWQQESFNKVAKVVREYTSRVRSIRGPNVGPLAPILVKKKFTWWGGIGVFVCV